MKTLIEEFLNYLLERGYLNDNDDHPFDLDFDAAQDLTDFMEDPEMKETSNSCMKGENNGCPV
jgi:hypothetical protein